MRDLYGAVEGGGTKFLCAVGTGPDDILAETRIPTTDPSTTLTAIAAFFAPYRERLRSLGVCAFGPLELDPRAGEQLGSLLDTPKAGWSRAPLRAQLQRALDVPVIVETDVNGAALAEQRWGAAHGADPVAYVTVGTGIGVGVVIGHKPLHGILHPEVGHVLGPRAPGDAFAGICPFHGACAEGLASAPALRARAGRDAAELTDDDPVWDFAAHTLGALLHTIVLAYAPERIVLGGGVLARGVLWPKVHAELARSLAGYVPRPQLSADGMAAYVVPPRFDRSGLLGGFAIAATSA